MDKCVIVIASIKRSDKNCFVLPLEEDYGRNHPEVLENFMIQFYEPKEVSFDEYFTDNIIIYVNKEDCLLYYPNIFIPNLCVLKEACDILFEISSRRIYAAAMPYVQGTEIIIDNGNQTDNYFQLCDVLGISKKYADSKGDNKYVRKKI